MNHRVVVLVRHGVMPLELGIVHQLFGSAGRYEVRTCALTPGEIRTDADFSLHVANGPSALAEADTVVIPSSHAVDETDADGRLSAELAAALKLIRPGTRTASICSGAFVLAAAGLLDGLVATTHWKSAERFRRLFPRVRLTPDVLYTDNGDILTSAGEAAGIDLCLHMIRRDHGAALANEVARTAVVAPHRDGGQAQFIARPVPAIPEASTGEAREWALKHLDQPLTRNELAKRASMSLRTFTRRFREEVGESPAAWLLGQRVERARQLLEESDLPVERVSEKAGFGTPAALRQQFQAVLGVSPRAYRATFRGQ